MTEFERTQQMPGDAALVFALASDVSALNDWLPENVQVEPSDRDPGVLRAHAVTGTEERDEIGVVDIDREEFRMEWGGRDTDRYTGWFEVAQGAPGHSTATLHLTFRGDLPETASGEAAEQVDSGLRAALDRLASLVAERQR
ncbi:Polyketide cyclase / dehydrase and lipid transport [Streptoalloteichus tenebrarius]|uniref:Polyketide cyclase / dehydrase and lipid transport n=1 Tax=Streptoalloteichus tenebrarius (strain ATCC 17920 / DSM 40477 / JCM 4838 / CBS 697.72 / NBRC 16177 / NCIMB 11028 / NRRL B-12390 / A12253. 1 / ISP 5477) TaxID=1933 RepID=A0ABT1HWC7_STRSD|nr:SRPBCC family protein [Streptoalloteichus tenebrarius]MCP2259812.1 Polyketide cyclase / dehydrase and lipid transport [Streptoalloteichus tenebrarius]BFE99241.1 hypothetical protein GCM10020241_09170 [Streptoalloteichus tenebrarius]